MRACLAPLPTADERDLRKLVLASLVYTTATLNTSAGCHAVMATLGCTIFGATLAVGAISKVGLVQRLCHCPIQPDIRFIAYVTFGYVPTCLPLVTARPPVWECNVRGVLLWGAYALEHPTAHRAYGD